MVRAGVPRSMELVENPSKKIKCGAGQVEHDIAIGNAMEGGDEERAVKIARQVVEAKAEYRDSVKSTPSLGEYSAHSKLRPGSEYRLHVTYENYELGTPIISEGEYSSDRASYEYSDGSDDITQPSFSSHKNWSLGSSDLDKELSDYYGDEAVADTDVFEEGQAGQQVASVTLYLLCFSRTVKDCERGALTKRKIEFSQDGNSEYEESGDENEMDGVDSSKKAKYDTDGVEISSGYSKGHGFTQALCALPMGTSVSRIIVDEAVSSVDEAMKNMDVAAAADDSGLSVNMYCVVF